MDNINVEKLYDNMREEIMKNNSKDADISNLWKEISKIDELLKNTISESEYDIFDDCLRKEIELIDLERRKAFTYGYKLSNKLIIDSLRE